MLRERRIRRLASEQRAGSWSRESAARKQYDFLRAHPLLPVFLLGLLAVTLPFVLLVPERTRSFTAGVLIATVFWLGVLLVRQLSGVGYLHLGELGEQWTTQQLRRYVRSKEWRLINRLQLKRHSDVDHVLVGPAGVIVIETKGGATDWMEPGQQGRIDAAVEQVRRNEVPVRGLVRAKQTGTPTHPVVVLWPAHHDFETRVVNGVTVLSGHRLSDWVAGLPQGGMSPDQVVDAWTALADTVERREQFEIEENGPPPRSMEQLAFDIVQFPLGVLTGFLAFAAIGQLGLFPLVGAALAALAVGALADRREYPLRRFVRGALLCASALVATLGALSLWHWIQ